MLRRHRQTNLHNGHKAARRAGRTHARRIVHRRRPTCDTPTSPCPLRYTAARRRAARRRQQLPDRVDHPPRRAPAPKRQLPPRIGGAFPVIITDVAYDLMNDPKWLAPRQYVDTRSACMWGEIGGHRGCRFVENAVKIFHAEDLAAVAARRRKRRGERQDRRRRSTAARIKPGALVGRQVLIGNTCVTVKNTASSMTVDAPVTVEDNAIYPAGPVRRNATCTPRSCLGADGYGTTEITGGGLESIVKSELRSLPKCAGVRSTSAGGVDKEEPREGRRASRPTVPSAASDLLTLHRK